MEPELAPGINVSTPNRYSSETLISYFSDMSQMSERLLRISERLCELCDECVKDCLG